MTDETALCILILFILGGFWCWACDNVDKFNKRLDELNKRIEELKK